MSLGENSNENKIMKMKRCFPACTDLLVLLVLDPHLSLLLWLLAERPKKTKSSTVLSQVSQAK